MPKKYYFLIPLVTILIAILGGFITSNNMDWYYSINIPYWTPPGFVIGTVWTVIYTLIALSAIIAYLKIFSNKKLIKKKYQVSVAFLANAFLNFYWTYLFFGKHLIGVSLFEIILLGISIVILIYLLVPISKIASLLLAPYLAWVTFATYLTYSVYILNK
ncbi:MAG: TspO/MBR family protein [Candidatus Levyibacteriota bacterium]